MMLEKILLPYDGSENSKGAKDYVKNLAEKFNSKVTILTVYELPLIIPSQDIPGFVYTDIEKDLYDNAIKISNDISTEMQQSNISTEIIISKGYPGQNINDIAHSKQIDLIVMGGQCLNGVKNFFIGSVSNYVLHHTDIPVLIVK